MLSFHGEHKLKETTLKDAIWHQEQDKFQQGVWWEGGKGCSLGCLLHYDNRQHDIFNKASDAWGLPMYLVKLQEHIFEGSTPKYALAWTARFVEVIPVGVDLDDVCPKIAIYICESVKQYAKGFKGLETVIQGVIDAHIAGSEKQLAAAGDAARDAARDAAWPAARAGYTEKLGNFIIETLSDMEGINTNEPDREVRGILHKGTGKISAETRNRVQST